MSALYGLIYPDACMVFLHEDLILNSGTFADIDECVSGEDDCDVNAECTNTDGGYNCSCRQGFHGNGSFCCE